MLRLFVLLILLCVSNVTVAQDEFKEWNDSSVSSGNSAIAKEKKSGVNNPTQCTEVGTCSGGCNKGARQELFGITMIVLTIIAGISVQFQSTRKLRWLFLVASLVMFGFYMGGCPCPVAGFQESILYALHAHTFIKVTAIVFLLLLPVTYFFGKVWCGWVCHLGAAQELLYSKYDPAWLRTDFARKVLKSIRAILFIILIVHLAITNTIYWKQIDPFKSIFNLSVSGYVNTVLVILLLLSSIFIYRPFCKAACPVGLVLGWVGKLPGAATMTKNIAVCKSCSACSKTCQMNAIRYGTNESKVDTTDCTACGDCIDVCKKNSMHIEALK